MFKNYDPSSDLNIQYFFDDFPGSLYNVQIWTTRSGSGSVAIDATTLGGLVRVRGNASNYYEIYQSALQFSLARQFEVTWQGALQSLTSSRAAWGMQVDATNRIEWIYEAALGANWRARTVSGGTDTGSVIDSLVVANTAWHEFKIIGVTGLVTFFLDGVLITRIIANLPTGALAPHMRSTSTTGAAAKDAYADWVEAFGNRAA